MNDVDAELQCYLDQPRLDAKTLQNSGLTLCSGPTTTLHPL